MCIRDRIVELDQIAGYIDRVGNDPAYVLLDDGFDLIFPVTQKGLCCRKHDLKRCDLHRENAEAGRISTRHDIGYRREIDLQGIDVEILQSELARKPFRNLSLIHI